MSEKKTKMMRKKFSFFLTFYFRLRLDNMLERKKKKDVKNIKYF